MCAADNAIEHTQIAGAGDSRDAGLREHKPRGSIDGLPLVVWRIPGRMASPGALLCSTGGASGSSFSVVFTVRTCYNGTLATRCRSEDIARQREGMSWHSWTLRYRTASTSGIEPPPRPPIFCNSTCARQCWPIDNSLALVGSPETVIEKIKDQQQCVGYDLLCTDHRFGGMATELLVKSMTWFGREVSPPLSARAGQQYSMCEIVRLMPSRRGGVTPPLQRVHRPRIRSAERVIHAQDRRG